MNSKLYLELAGKTFLLFQIIEMYLINSRLFLGNSREQLSNLFDLLLGVNAGSASLQGKFLRSSNHFEARHLGAFSFWQKIQENIIEVLKGI